jgi:GDP-L-fucose synthase
MKILVCGATGFIGRNMVQYFAADPNNEVLAVHFRREAYDAPSNVKFVCADLRDPQVANDIVQGIDVIIQAAATTSGSKDIVTKPYIHVTDNSVMNSYLFRAAFDAKVKHVIFFSCTVMYQSSEHPLKESDFNSNDELHPRYFGVGHTKLYIEKMCDFFSRIGQTKFTAIRHSNIYGPHDKFDLERSHVFGATITKVMQADNHITVWGTGEEERDLLYVDDLSSFVDLCLKKQSEKYRLYNCGLGQAISIKDLVHKIVTASGKKLNIQHDLSQPTIKTSLCVEYGLAQRELGWKPQISLDEGITRTIAWWRENVPAALKAQVV